MGGPGYKFRDELDGDGTYSRGTLAMANAGPNTNGSQFFIMHKDVGLPHSYSIFGKVTDGLDVVDSIASTDTDGNDRPKEEVKISSVEINES
jgi:cyclophilin family peptidyl-prolyl cis-trans isomerase